MLVRFLGFAAIAAMMFATGGCAMVGSESKSLVEPAGTAPLIQDVDVVVVGGSSGAVAAAQAAAQNGARVFLVTSYPCLGEDIAGTLHVWTKRSEIDSPLMRAMFDPEGKHSGSDADAMIYTTPLDVKKALDHALLDANVRFLTGVFATDILTDADGVVSGVIITDRSGRQAIRAKVVVDATARGGVARMAGAEMTPFAAGTYTVTRVVVSDDAPEGPGKVVHHRDWKPDADLIGLSKKSRLKPALYECTMEVAMPGGSMRAFQDLEQTVRDRTFTKSQMDAADFVRFTPPDHFRSACAVVDDGATADDIDVVALQPDGLSHLYVLGATADVPRAVAERLSEPGQTVALGTRLGKHIATEAKQRGDMRDVRRRGANASGPAADLRHVEAMLTSPYIAASGDVPCDPATLPILAETDLLVVGGGTTGAPAAVGASQQGVKTLVVEFLNELGGVQTAGMICGYYYGFKRGFTKEIDAGVKKTGWVRSQAKAEWYRKSIREGGGEIWFGCMAVGAYMDGTRLRGVVVATPDGGCGVVLAKAVIDSTGNADVAAAAGEPTEFYDKQELIGQGVGMAPILLGQGGHNNDFGYVNDTDASDLSFFALRTRLMTDDAWDVSQIVNSRERRRIVGVFQIRALDYLTARTYPDTVNQHRSRFDLHGDASGDFFHTKQIRTINHVTLEANAPYRALLPKTTDGLLVGALGMSATRDAMAILRMQPDLQNQGYAMACAAKMALERGCELRNIPVRELQQQLVDVGNIPPEVLTETDSYPISDTRLRLATHNVMMGYGDVAYLFAAPKRARAYLLERYKELGTHSSGINEEVQLVYAHLLAVLGDPTGQDELIAWVETHNWGGDWSPGLSARGNRMCAYILALTRAHSEKAIPALVRQGLAYCKHRSRPPSTRVSRLYSIAADSFGDPAFADVLVTMLDYPGVSGHAIAMSADIPPVPGYGSRTNYSHDEKRATTREFNLAAALYRLGDKDGKGEAILKAYANDPRGFYAHYARRVLGEETPSE